MSEEPIRFIDRGTRQRCVEKVYGARFLALLYGQTSLSRWIGAPLRYLASRFALFSRLMGWYQRLPCTRRHIEPFIQAYGVDASEFEKRPDQFTSFDDFFCRKLNAASRPIHSGDDVAVIPTDGRFYFYENVSAVGSFDIKGQSFDLKKFLQDDALAEEYSGASMVLGRLCPSDYHRFHFPIRCVPTNSRLINGYWYSVNPLAVRQNVAILWENKRMLTTLHSDVFGDVLMVEIGATSVGTIRQTYIANQEQDKGAEKGYFAFGGSALVVLFPKGCIRFDADLLAATQQHLEMRCFLGQRLGVKKPEPVPVPEKTL